MGQIVGGAAKPKRCNLQSLSSLGTPAAGEYILVSSDNSMNAAGQGNFDCYIEGNGQTVATALELHKCKAEELDAKLYGDTQESLLPESTWFDDNVFSQGYGTDTDKIYFDTRNVVDEHHKIKQFKIYRLASGTMRIYFLKKLDFSIVTYKEIEITSPNGVHTYDLTLEDEYYNNGEMIVGIHSSFVWGSKTGPEGFSTTSYSKSISTDEIVAFTQRRFGYGIVVEAITIGDIDEIKANISDIDGMLYETMTTPSENWINGTFTTNGGGSANFAYFDERMFIPAKSTINAIRLKATGAGLVSFYLLKASDFSILATTTEQVVAGINDIAMPFDNSLLSTRTFIAISSASSIIAMRGTRTSGETSYTKQIDVTTSAQPTSVNYALGMDITYTAFKTSQISQDLTEAIEQGGNDIVLGPYDYAVTEPIILASGMTIRGSFGKTRLILSDGCTTAISASNANDIKIADLEIVGTCPTYSYAMNGIIAGTGYDMVETESDALALNYMGTEKGIYLYHCENVVLENLKINHITGSAIRVDYVGRNYIKGLNANNLFITNCYNGIYTENEHEFSQYTNWTITLCMIGVYCSSGNLIFTAGHATRCRVAIMFVDGLNNAHGIVNGVEIKHNQIAGILCNGVTNGEFFQGVYMQYCALIIRDSTGLYFDDLMVSNMSIDATGSNGVNKIGKLVKGNGIVTINNTDTLTIIETVQVY